MFPNQVSVKIQIDGKMLRDVVAKRLENSAQDLRGRVLDNIERTLQQTLNVRNQAAITSDSRYGSWVWENYKFRSFEDPKFGFKRQRGAIHVHYMHYIPTREAISELVSDAVLKALADEAQSNSACPLAPGMSILEKTVKKNESLFEYLKEQLEGFVEGNLDKIVISYWISYNLDAEAEDLSSLSQSSNLSEGQKSPYGLISDFQLVNERIPRQSLLQSIAITYILIGPLIVLLRLLILTGIWRQLLKR